MQIVVIKPVLLKVDDRFLGPTAITAISTFNMQLEVLTAETGKFLGGNRWSQQKRGRRFRLNAISTTRDTRSRDGRTRLEDS